MPLETFPLLQDNTRLVQHGEILYKLRVKYDRESLRHLTMSEAEAHHEIVQVFRAVIHMILSQDQIVEPILTRHFLVHIQQSQWGFLKKYKSLVFSKRNKVLSVHENVTDFLVKNIPSALTLPKAQTAVKSSLQEIRKNHQSSDVIIIDSSQEEKPNTRRQNDSGKEKRRGRDEAKEPAVIVYSGETSQPNQGGSRFYRDESGRMCRVVQANPEHCDKPDNADDSEGTQQQTDQHPASADRTKPRSHAAVEKKSDQLTSGRQGKNKIQKIQALTKVTTAPNRASPRGKRRSERLRAVDDHDSDSKGEPVERRSQRRREQERRKVGRNQQRRENANEEVTLTEGSDSGSDFKNQSRPAANRASRRKSRRLENKQTAVQIESSSSQSETQTESDTDTDLEPVSKKVKLRSAVRLSDEEGQGSQEEARELSRPQRGSERLTRHTDPTSSQSEEEETDSKQLDRDTESQDSKKQRKRKLYAACSSPQLITGASQEKPAFSSPRISTVRPVKRDTAGGAPGQGSVGARGQHVFPRRPRLAASPRSRRLQEEETRRMEQLRNAVGPPVVPDYRNVLHNRRDRHAVEQAEREETTKLLQLYEPTVPRKSPRHVPESVNASSSGVFGKIYDTLMTPAKKLLGRK